MKKSLIFILFNLVWSSFSLAIDSYKEFSEGLLELQYRGQYISSDSNFNSSGSIVSLGSGKYYKLVDSELAARLGFVEKWAAEMTLRFPMAESFDGISKRTNSSVSEISMGLETMILTEYVDFVPELQVVFPLESFSLQQTSALNGEGVMQIKLLLNMQKNMGTWSPYGYFGFNHRAEGRSWLLPWLVGVNFGKENIFGAEVYGYQPLTEDKDAPDKTQRLNFLTNVNAGSYYFAWINPVSVDAKAYYRAHMSDFWMFQFEMGITPMGWDSAYDYHVGGFLRFNFELWEGGPLAKTRIKRRIRIDKDAFLKTQDQENTSQFKEDTRDGVDQGLFKEKPSEKPKPKKNQEGLSLDDVDLQIEIKAFPKRK